MWTSARRASTPDEAIQADIVKILREAQANGLSKTEVTGRGGNAVSRRKVLERMVDDGMVVERPKPGHSTAKMYWLPVYAPSP
jgi:hypothetical protein